MAGLLPADASVEDCERVYETNLRLAASRFAQRRVEAVIEPINHRDIPSYFLNTTRQALAVIERVGAPNLKLQLDLYHAQITEGDLVHHVRDLPGVTHTFRLREIRIGTSRILARSITRTFSSTRCVRLRRLGGLRVSAEERDARRAWLGPAVWNHSMKTRVAILSDFNGLGPSDEPAAFDEEIELEDPSYGKRSFVSRAQAFATRISRRSMEF